jgi:serine/threonine-protein kinase
MDRVGRYQLLEKLGEGGMGVVYKAFDPLIQRVVAVKQISSARTDDPVIRERFFAEARAAGHLSHRNIVTVYDLGEEGGQPFFAMEFLEGRDLGRMIRSGEPASLAAKIDLMAQAARGLAYAHARGVIHRDVKPANIFVTIAGDVKVLDFGLARLARPVASDLTRTKPFLGTVSYMAPEQVRGEPADPRTDLFAFGVVFYELLSGGRPAFETDSFASTMHRILTEEPEPLTALDRSLSPELIRIVERALAKSRDDRYQRMDDMLADMAAFRATLTAPGGTPQLPGRALPPHAPSVDGLALTVGTEAAVDVRTPPPATPPPTTPPPASMPVTPVGLMTPTPRSPRRRAWIAVTGLLGAGLIAGGVWTGLGRQDPGNPASASPGQAGVMATAGEPAKPEPGPSAPAQPQPDPSQPASGSAAVQPDPTAGPAPAGRGRSDMQGQSPTTKGATPEPARETSATSQPRKADDRIRTGAHAAFVEAARAKGRAESAAADRLAPATFAEALKAEQAATRRFEAGAFEQARSGFAGAEGLYERAESEARAEQARLEERERAREAVETARNRFVRARAAAAAANATTGAASEAFTDAERNAAEAQDLLVAGEPLRAAERFHAAATLMEQARAQADAPQPPPSTPASPIPAGSAVGEGAAPPSATSEKADTSTAEASAAATEQEISALLSRYVQALEARSLSRLKRIWPTLGGSQEQAIAQEFRHARAISVRLADPRIAAAGSTAQVTCQRTYQLETQDGQRLQTGTRTVFTVRRAGEGWVIEDVRHEATR